MGPAGFIQSGASSWWGWKRTAWGENICLSFIQHELPVTLARMLVGKDKTVTFLYLLERLQSRATSFSSLCGSMNNFFSWITAHTWNKIRHTLGMFFTVFWHPIGRLIDGEKKRHIVWQCFSVSVIALAGIAELWSKQKVVCQKRPCTQILPRRHHASSSPATLSQA